jgi:hypothetical protein
MDERAHMREFDQILKSWSVRMHLMRDSINGEDTKEIEEAEKEAREAIASSDILLIVSKDFTSSMHFKQISPILPASVELIDARRIPTFSDSLTFFQYAS